MTSIYESYTADYTSIVHKACRSDGQWFVRLRIRNPWGWTWTPWRPTSRQDNNVGRKTDRYARLPKG